MAVRVQIRLKPLRGGKGELSSSALLNAGYESATPEIILPIGVAKRLGLWPKLPEGTEIGAYEVAGGGLIRTYFIEECLEIEVITEDRVSGPVKTAGVIIEGEKEILLSDKLIDALQLVLESAGIGLWRFKGEQKIRKSTPTQYWEER